jgi:prepilin-type N-terminal cleavage/methylation domain-containing protein
MRYALCHGMKTTKKKGFTLIELLIVISVTIILAGATIPVFGGWQSMSQLNESRAQITQMLRMARQYSIAGYNDNRHGVYLEINAFGADKVIYYQGDSYLARLPEYDISIILENAVEMAATINDNDVNFSKNNGLPSAIGVISLENNLGSSYQLRVNEIGVVTEN